VTLAATGDGFKDGVVSASSADGTSSGASAFPDATGRYTLTVEPGPYKVRFNPSGGLELGPDPREYTRVFFDNADDIEQADVVTVAADGVVNNINFALVRGGRIAGRVTFAQGGGGAGGVTVSVFGGRFASPFTQSGSAVVNAAGYYTLPALANGVYTVTTTYTGTLCRYPAQRHAQNVTVSGPGVIPNIDIALVEGAFITGRVVVSATNAGIATQVRALDPGDDGFFARQTATANANGHYRLGPLVPGTYQVQFVPATSTGLGILYAGGVTDRAAAQTFTVTSGQVVGGIDVRLLPAPDEPDVDGKVYLPAVVGNPSP
jgi:protocatechuate 3,4-dioxygenase beta subunit